MRAEDLRRPFPAIPRIARSGRDRLRPDPPFRAFVRRCQVPDLVVLQIRRDHLPELPARIDAQPIHGFVAIRILQQQVPPEFVSLEKIIRN